MSLVGLLLLTAVDPMAVLKQNRDAMFALKSYQVTCVRKSTFDKVGRKAEYSSAKLVLAKPNKMRYDEWQLALPPTNGASTYQTIVCDGKQCIFQIANTYRKWPYQSSKQLQNSMGIGTEFFDVKSSYYDSLMAMRKEGSKFKISYDGTGTVEGVTCQKVTIDTTDPADHFTQVERETQYFGVKDHLVHRIDSYTKFQGGAGTHDIITFRDIVLNRPAKSTVFVYIPPSGVKLRTKG